MAQTATPLKAVLLMLLSAIFFAGMSITIRMAAREQHAFEIAFFRNLFGLLFALPLLYGSGLKVLRTGRLGLYFVRCIVGLCSMLSGFWALVHLPLAEAIALSYTTPLFVTIGAVLLLGEVVRARRWTAVAIGFVGMLVILRPGIHPLGFAAAVALLSAALSASAAISVKFLSRTEPADAIVIYMVLIMTPLSLLPALAVWQWPSVTALCWMGLTGLLGTLGHVALTRAYKLGEVSALQSINFVQLPVVAGLAWWLFDEALDGWTALGAGIIFASTFYIGRREAMLARRSVTDEEIGRESAANR